LEDGGASFPPAGLGNSTTESGHRPVVPSMLASFLSLLLSTERSVIMVTREKIKPYLPIIKVWNHLSTQINSSKEMEDVSLRMFICTE
jgi:hypothetical protein